MEPIDIFEKLRKKRLIIFSLVLSIFTLSVGSVLLLMEKTAKKANAGVITLSENYTLRQSDNLDWSNDDVIIGSKNVRIDGEHTFRNLTIQNGGELTTTDFNSYGISNERDPFDQTFSTAMDFATQSYEFIVRGYILVGSSINTRTFNVTSGNPMSWTADATGLHPASMRPDDVASIEFYSAVSEGETYNQDDFKNAPVGHAFGGISGGTISYVDLAGAEGATTEANKYYPFELRFVNTGGLSHFGITSCLSSSDCSLRENNSFVNILTHGIDDDFDEASSEVQLKTFKAWQGGAKNGGIYSGSKTDYPAFTAHFDSQKSKTAGQTNYDYDTNFLVADNYDMRTDQKAVIRRNINMLSPSARAIDDRADQNVFDLWKAHYGGDSNYFAFYASNNFYSPLASRVVRLSHPHLGNGDHAVETEPILSRAVIKSMPVKELTKIKISGTLTVKSGGKINVNGKGFASSKVYYGVGQPGGGSGPAGARTTGNGASHAGAGGSNTYIWPGCNSNLLSCRVTEVATSGYDTDSSKEPALPGSGAGLFWIYNGHNISAIPSDQSNYYGYGGGYIKIEAEKIILESGSIVMANGVSGSGSWAAGASGGSIVLSDSSASSTYDGVISAMGASANGNYSTVNTGGGGGYVSIETLTDTAVLSNLRNFSSSLPLSMSIASHREPTISDYVSNGFANKSISVSGGKSTAGDGSQGILRLRRYAPPDYKITKILLPVERNGKADTAFNPYGAILGDKIKVQLHVEGLAPGTKITDDLLKTNVPSLICGDLIEITPVNTQAIPPETLKQIIWVHSTNETSKDFYYTCRMKKL